MEKTNRQDLIRFLGACFDAEQSIYECSRLIEVLEKERHEINRKVYGQPLPNLPDEPKMPVLQCDRTHEARKKLEELKKQLKSAILSMDLTSVKFYRRWVKEAEAALEQAEIETLTMEGINKKRLRKYETEKTEWDSKNTDYHTGLRMQAESMTDQLMEEQRTQQIRLDHLRSIRARLYDTGILYTDFQNVDAIFQLQKYLIMGVAETLEGPDGAYRIYLNDLNTQKIMGSINDLRESVEKGFQTVLYGQKEIYDQMKQMNTSLQQVDRNLSSHFDSLHQMVVSTGASLSKTIQEESKYREKLLSDIHNDQAKISEIIQKSAYNQYLTSRQENLDNYLVYMIQNPLI